jgi:hypothetical protein
MQAWWQGRTRWERAAIAIWGAILLFVTIRVLHSPQAKTVYPIFSASGRFWWSGIDLYEPDRPAWVQNGYRYSPTFAILVTPFAIFPDGVGGALWRLTGTAALIGALAWLARSVWSVSLSRDQFAALTLLMLPLSLQSVNNGQANIVVTAAMLVSVAAVRAERWNLVTAMIALAFVCKLYPIALGLLLMVLYPRRLGWRIPLALLLGLVLPFAFQSPDYVVDQYQKWFALLGQDDRHQLAPENSYRDLWLLIRLCHLPIRHGIYPYIQVGAGAVIAALLWWRQRRGWPQRTLLTATLALATTWMMLLGPATESSSFVLLAPPLAWSLLEAWQRGARGAGPRLLLLGGSAALFTAAVFLGGFSTTVKIHALGVHSWASLLYFLYLLTEPAPPAEQQQQEQVERRAAA